MYRRGDHENRQFHRLPQTCRRVLRRGRKGRGRPDLKARQGRGGYHSYRYGRQAFLEKDSAPIANKRRLFVQGHFAKPEGCLTLKVFFDSSALAKRYVSEKGTHVVLA